MKLLLSAILIVGVSFAYGDDCARGQAYWCSDLKVAKSCDAVQHCIDNVWSQQTPYSQDAGDICKFCEDVITDVRGFFSKDNEAKVQKYLDSACGIIPVPELSDRCKDYVKNDIDELYQLIRSKLDPKAVCSAMQLCSSYKDLTHVAMIGADKLIEIKAIQDDVPRKTTTPSPAQLVCKDCQKLFIDMKAYLASQSEEKEIEDYFKKSVCAQLGPLSDECNQLVEQYVPELVQLINEQVDPNMICGVLGLCQGGDKSLLPRMRLTNSPLFKAASKAGGPAECDACKVIMSELRDLDRNKVIQKDIENLFLTKLCPALGSLKAECIQTVQEYGQFLFEFLANELDPDTRCQSLGFCSSANSVRLFATRQATLLVKAKHSETSKLKQSAQCILCEFVMTQVDGLLEKNTSEKAIISALDKVCAIMPDTIKKECTDFVNTYAPAIIDLLAQEMDPQLVCSSLGLCKMSSMKNVVKSTRVQQNSVLKSNEYCGVCETVVQYMDSLLEENATEAQMEAAAEKVCNFLPKNLEKECDDFVEQHGPEVIQLLLKFADPHKVCQELGLCPTKTKVSSMEVIRPAKAALVGVNECTYGPAFWCSSRDNAKKCGAVAHCEKHGWKN